MKISEIAMGDVASYLRLEEDDYDPSQMAAMMAVATAYLSGSTGIPTEELDDYPDFWLAFMVLCQDMYCNRTRTVDKVNLNQTVEDIISLHRRNFL